MEMQLFPIPQAQQDALPFLEDANCRSVFPMQQAFYEAIGNYEPPWIGYFVELNEQWVGTCAFKGAPQDRSVEIAYYTFEPFEGQGIGTEMCRQLVQIAQTTNPEVRVTARTLPEANASTSILQKNGFRLLGAVEDPEDGTVWEWEYLSEASGAPH